jgi:Flp pilus assembly protein TadG
MARRFTRRLARNVPLHLARNQRGSVIIELAFIAPILATMIVGVVDLSAAYGRKLVLEQAAQRAVEKIMQTTGEDTVDATIRNEAAAAAGIPVSQVTVAFTMTCNGVSTNYATQCADNSTEVRYIEISLWDKYTPIIPATFAGMNSDGTYTLTATNGIRTQ